MDWEVCGDLQCNANETVESPYSDHCPSDCGPGGAKHFQRCRRELTLALTFNEGPTAGVTEVLLDALKYEQVPASFFTVAARLEDPRTRSIVRRAAAEGHGVYSQGYMHLDWQSLDLYRLRKELVASEALVRQSTCRSPRLTRPPWGHHNETTRQALQRMGYTAVGWSLDSEDHSLTTQDPTVVMEAALEALNAAYPEGIITLHHDTSIEAVTLALAIIRRGKQLGYKFVTLDDCVYNKSEAVYQYQFAVPCHPPEGGGNCTRSESCAGHGRCVEGQCVCHRQWTCPYCHMRDVDTPSALFCDNNEFVPPAPPSVDDLRETYSIPSCAQPLLFTALSLSLSVLHTATLLLV